MGNATHLHREKFSLKLNFPMKTQNFVYKAENKIIFKM